VAGAQARRWADLDCRRAQIVRLVTNRWLKLVAPGHRVVAGFFSEAPDSRNPLPILPATNAMAMALDKIPGNWSRIIAARWEPSGQLVASFGRKQRKPPDSQSNLFVRSPRSLFASRGPNGAPGQEREDQHGESVDHWPSWETWRMP
jgi:hypothetical protein